MVTLDDFPPGHVPTVPELYRKKLATVQERNKKGDPTHYRLTPEGQDLITQAMLRNARNNKENRP
ncbi:hypothetical protein [Curtobacterium sp. MCSS17_016]|uniref:hypothetical protein n=1 Tax=Curtobacterium sp. MCSS17_016 TaxID=2175644 RepID=UPI000DA99C60|nr:hypothetical protein [Curtobacterium sp. MCSS17_016]WIE81381.1 hypothetical protein DEJ19_019290 [Curtobacterium sp. MCSS17_016]